MKKDELIDYIDKTFEIFKRGHQLESEENKADLISDLYIYDMDFKIAQFAIINNHHAMIQNFTLKQLVTEDELEYEDGTYVNIYELISDWISTSLGTVLYDYVVQDTVSQEIIEVIKYYDNKTNEYYNTLE